MHRISLEGWKLTLSKPDHADWTHQHIRLDKDDDYCATFTVASIPAGALVMRSVLLAMNETEREPDYAEECLIGLILQQGYLDQRSLKYRADLSDFLNTLTPRKFPNECSKESICDHLNQKMIANVFHLNNGSFLMRWGSFINHSCLPNTVMIIDRASAEAQFVSLRKIRAGEEITVCYFAWPINSRQARDQMCQRLGFKCKCVLCRDRLPLSVFLPLLNRAPSQDHCWWCGKAAELRCRACDLASYCNKRCLRQDRQEHRPICKKLYHCSSNACSGS